MLARAQSYAIRHPDTQRDYSGRVGETVKAVDEGVNLAVAGGVAYIVFIRAQQTKSLLNNLGRRLDALLQGKSPLTDFESKAGLDMLITAVSPAAGLWYAGIETYRWSFNEGTRRLKAARAMAQGITVKTAMEVYEGMLLDYKAAHDGWAAAKRLHESTLDGSWPRPVFKSYEDWSREHGKTVQYPPPPEYTRSYDPSAWDRAYAWSEPEPMPPDAPPEAVKNKIVLWDEALLFALVAFTLMRNPDNVYKMVDSVGNLLRGIGEIVKGVGEIVPL